MDCLCSCMALTLYQLFSREEEPCTDQLMLPHHQVLDNIAFEDIVYSACKYLLICKCANNHGSPQAKHLFKVEIRCKNLRSKGSESFPRGKSTQMRPPYRINSSISVKCFTIKPTLFIPHEWHVYPRSAFGRADLNSNWISTK